MEDNILQSSFGSVTLTVAPTQMYQTASDLETKIASSQKLFAEMIDIIKNTSAYWEGNVAQQERNNFLGENDSFENLISNLTNYVSELKIITSVYQLTENAVSAEAQSLPDNILE